VVALNQYELLDQSVPYVKESTVQVQKTYGVGTISFEFDWETIGPATVDRVVITHVSGGGYCADYERTIQRSAAQSQTQKNFNEYEHHVEWLEEDCHPNCAFDVEVFSDNPVASSWSSKKRVTIKSCIGGM